MKRINVVINASEMSTVRKAIFTAGASGLVIVQMPHGKCIGELGDWYCGKDIATREDHMRLEVTSDDNRSDDIISAILSTAHAAKIEYISAAKL